MKTMTEKVTPPAKLAHIVLRSGKYEETITWWTALLGLEIVHETPFATFLTYDDEHHRIVIFDVSDATPATPQHTGLEHVAFTQQDLATLVDNYVILKARGIEPHWCVNHGMTLSMYYRDPDGIQVEFQVDLCTPLDAVAFMKTPAFAENPIGVDYDPEVLVEEVKAGKTPTAPSIWGPLHASQR